MISEQTHPKAEGPGPYGEVVTLAYPVVLSMLAQTVMGLVDTLFMGWVSTAAQGAVGLGGTITWAGGCFFLGTLTAVNTVVAQRFGAGQKDSCGSVAYHGMVLAALSALILIASGVPLLPRLIAVFASDPEVAAISGSYAAIRTVGMAFGAFEMTLASFMRGVGDTKTPMKVAVVAMVLNVPLNYWLIFGGLGVPALGADGAAYATVASTAFTAVMLVVLFARPKWRALFGTGWPQSLRRGELAQLLKVGLPIGGHWVLEMGSWTVFTVAVASFGATSLAAHNIVLQVLHVSFMPGVGLSVAATTLVGQAIGAQDRQVALSSSRASLLLAMGYMAIMGLVFLFGGRGIALLFSRDAEVVVMCQRLFWLAAAFQIFDAMGMVAGGVLRGAAMTRFPMLASLFCSVLLLLPGFYLFGVVLEGGVVGAWGGATAYIMVLGAVLLIKVRRGTWLEVAPLQLDGDATVPSSEPVESTAEALQPAADQLGTPS